MAQGQAGKGRGAVRGSGGLERLGQEPPALALLTLCCGGRPMHRGRFSSTQHPPTAASSTHRVMTTKMSPDIARCPHRDKITLGGEPLSRNKSLKTAPNPPGKWPALAFPKHSCMGNRTSGPGLAGRAILQAAGVPGMFKPRLCGDSSYSVCLGLPPNFNRQLDLHRTFASEITHGSLGDTVYGR